MLCFATYLLSLILHGFTIYVIIESWDKKIVLSKIFVIMSIAASVVIGEWGSERKKKYFQQICAPLVLLRLADVTQHSRNYGGSLWKRPIYYDEYDVLTSKEANVVSVLNFGYFAVIGWLLRKLTQKRSDFA